MLTRSHLNPSSFRSDQTPTLVRTLHNFWPEYLLVSQSTPLCDPPLALRHRHISAPGSSLENDGFSNDDSTQASAPSSVDPGAQRTRTPVCNILKFGLHSTATPRTILLYLSNVASIDPIESVAVSSKYLPLGHT
ncbi:hypothetical protein CC2G_010428 [Coprinopsis cinerea AmutBmut pab1-1]|nr:hypothetical protein CC2G_010428 [Coprinopsis cinerea AmutBmut pab1-1]